MTKTRRQMAEYIKQVDAVCEVVDARIPQVSRNPDMDEIAAGKPRMMILNRIDLADPNMTAVWAKHFREQGMAVIQTDSRSGNGTQAFSGAVRTLLADCGIHEGVYLTKPLLQAAQAQALRRSETFGWISLNFTGGCLSVESTPAQTQTVRDPPPRQGLYAAADGEVLAVEIESGFAAVAVGEQVTAGQPLAVAEKLDRKGNAVPQGAWGRIVARVQKQYTAAQALEYEALVYTGRSSAAETLYLPGYAHTRPAETPLAGEEQTEWLPLRLGRLALPACICRVTTWEQQTQPVRLTDTAAVALAVRTCRAQLLRDFPDAEIEAEQRETTTENGTAAAAVTYIFTADIARTR